MSKHMKSIRKQIAAMREQLTELERSLTDDELNFIADTPPIENLLEWGGRISDNFYNTVQYHLRTALIGIGQYDMPTGIILALTNEVGLQILPDYNRYIAGKRKGHPVDDEDWGISLDFQFVPLPEKNWLSEPVRLPDGDDSWVPDGLVWEEDEDESH